MRTTWPPRIPHLLLWLLPAVMQGQPPQANRGKIMNEAQNKAIELTKAAGEKHATVSDAELDSMTDQLAPGDEEDVPPVVLAIGVAPVYEAAKMERMPVFVAKRWTGLRSWEVDMLQNQTWILTDMRSGRTQAAVPLTLDKKRMAMPKPSRTPPEPSAVDRTAVTYGIEKQFLPALYGRDWPGARYAVSMVVYDLASNRVSFVRDPQPEPPKAEAVRTPTEFVTAKAGGAAALEIQGEGGKISGGIVGAKETQVMAKSSEPSGEPVVMVSLVLRMLDSTAPIVVDLVLPAAEADGKVNTAFSLESAKFPALVGLKGEYKVYLVAGELQAGPATLRLQ